MGWLCGLSGRLPGVKSSRRNTALCPAISRHVNLSCRTACRTSGLVLALVLWRMRGVSSARVVRAVRTRACRLREHAGGSRRAIVRHTTTGSAFIGEAARSGRTEYRTNSASTVQCREEAPLPRTRAARET